MNAKPVLAGTVLALAGLLGLDFLSIRATRISGTSGIHVFDALSTLESATVISVYLGMAAATLLRTPRRHALTALLACLGMFLVVFFGARGAVLAAGDLPAARVFLASGAWFAILGSALIFSAESAFVQYKSFRFGVGAILFLFLGAMLGTGQFDDLSIMREYANRSGRFWQEAVTHVTLSGLAVSAAVFIGVPLGFAAFSRKRFKKTIFGLTNSIQTIPSLALFGLLISPLALLSKSSPFLARMGVKGIGWTPALIALSMYALLPVVRNTYTAFKIIDAAVIDAGKGMGMNRRQLFFTVQLPVALPVILGGIRIAGVQTVGNTAVAALIGAGGLGQFIFQGLGEAAPDLILLGALSTVVLALAADGMFGALADAARPGGLKEGAEKG
ncbi:MAG: ABC transporter permease [Thermovirgaceae bacterium]